MKKHESLLLQTLKAGMGYGELPECENWNGLFEFSKKHSLANLFYNAVKDSERVPAEVKNKAKQHFLANTAQQISQEYYASEMFSRFEEAGIKYSPLKGYVLRKLYPAPELRISCDVDVFYDETRKKDVYAIMQELGFENEGDSVNHGEWMKEAVTIETHHQLAAQNDLYHDYYEDIWDRLKTKNGSLYEFSDEDFYIYFFVHAAKHFAHGGFGVRTVLDVYVYTHNKTLDRAYLDTEFEKIKLKKFVQTIENLSEVWFGERQTDEDSELLGEYIFGSGTYGLSSNNAVINNVNEGKSVKKTKISYFFKTIFPSYKIMKSHYPILKKLPFLLPFAWIVKWFAVLFKRRERFGVVVRNVKSVDEKKIDKAARILELTEIPMD